MPKVVRMVAEIVTEKCTGCNLCVLVCPTVALGLRARRPDEPGPGRKVAVLDASACYNAQNCLEICPDDAIVMRDLDPPFTVGFDQTTVDTQAVERLCAATGLPPALGVCVCTRTTVAEIAGAILAGADTPEKVALATGARTGCTELCLQPILLLLAAAGHGEKPTNPPGGFQWYGVCGTLYQHAQLDGSFPEDLVKDFPAYPLDRELLDLMRLRRS